MARFDIALQIDYEQAQRAILTALATQLTRAAYKAKPKIESRLVPAIELAIQSSPEASSLRGGRLQGELGVLNPEEAIRAVVTTLQKNIFVGVSPFYVSGNGLGGGLSIGISRRDMSDILTLPEGKFVSEGQHEIPWLRWLLTAGDTIVVFAHHFQAGSVGRTGLGHMVQRGGWTVPPAFAGTIENNWITRSLTTLGNTVNRILMEEMHA